MKTETTAAANKNNGLTWRVQKICAKCGRPQLASTDRHESQFGRDRNTRDGFYPRCKTCRSEQHEAKAEEIKPVQRDYYRNRIKSDPEFAAQERARGRAYNAANPEKRRNYNTSYYRQNKKKWVGEDGYNKKRKLGEAGQPIAESEEG